MKNPNDVDYKLPYDPPPWTATKREHGGAGGSETWRDIKGAHNGTIGMVYYVNDGTDEEMEQDDAVSDANVRLILAAPELHATVRQLLDVYLTRQVHPTTHEVGEWPDKRCVICRATVVLAKVEGTPNA